MFDGRGLWILPSTEARLIRRHRRWFVHLLTLAFLCAQLGMAVHASTHLKGEPHPAQSQLCGQCLSFAPLQNMVGGSAAVILPVSVSHDRAVDTVTRSLEPRQAFSAFRSRAPPSP